MKNKIALASAALIAASSVSQAEIVINDFLSVEGFIDMSYSHSDVKVRDLDVKASNNNFAVDQVEISWLFDFDPVTAQIDTTYFDANGSTTMGYDDNIEQAFVTYHMEEGAITAGRFYSMLGFEAFKAPGLYQYSTAYAGDGMIGDYSILPDGGQGVKYTYNDESFFFGFALMDSTFGYDQNRLGGSTPGFQNSSWAVELAGAFMMEEGLTFFLGGAYEDVDNDFFKKEWVINGYVTYEMGAWLFAGELNYGQQDIDAAGKNKAWSGLLMANFAYSDEASVTGRYSYTRLDPDAVNAKPAFHKWTLAHNYAFTDNLGLVTEYSYINGNSDSAKYREHLAAVELIFTF